MKKIIIALFTLMVCFSIKAQNKDEASKPKLVVGIVVDQMRYDYLTRFIANLVKADLSEW